MTQKDLATAIQERPQVIQELESGKAIPNPAILQKLGKVTHFSVLDYCFNITNEVSECL